MKKALMVGVVTVTLGPAGVTHAGNIVLTGHDNDFHYHVLSTDAKNALTAEFSFIRNGSILPLLVLDAGAQLVTAANDILGAANVVARAPSLVTAADFNPTVYRAFAVASDRDCGGCDNSSADIASITAQSAAITGFLNAGGGILGLAGGAFDDLTYAYVTIHATNAEGFPPTFGYVQTADGLALGLPAVNGDERITSLANLAPLVCPPTTS